MDAVPTSGSLAQRFRLFLAEHESSDRSFGFLTSIVFLLIGVQPLLHGGEMRGWSLIGAVDMLLLALVYPRSLRGTKRLWLFLGFVLGNVVNPVVLALLFYAVVTPAGYLLRLCGGDPLRLKLAPHAATYWLPRTAAPGSLTDQF